MSQYTVKFFHVKSGKNAGIILVYGKWLSRILKHRGWKVKIYERSMTQDEYDYVKSCMRYVATRYKSLSDLLEDERMIIDCNAFEIEKAILESALMTQELCG